MDVAKGSGSLPGPAPDPELAGPLELAFADALPIAADGSGNFWVVDVDPQSGAWGTVFYLCHDPCDVVLQATSIAEFLEQVLQSGKPDEWRLISALSSDHPRIQQDEELRAFADELDGGYRIADLRAKEIGSGFSYEQDGDVKSVRRLGTQLVFAIDQQ
jgi:hypothetical protein